MKVVAPMASASAFLEVEWEMAVTLAPRAGNEKEAMEGRGGRVSEEATRRAGGKRGKGRE